MTSAKIHQAPAKAHAPQARAASEGARALKQAGAGEDFAATMAELENAADLADMPVDLMAKAANPQATQPVTLDQLNWAVEAAPANIEPTPKVLNQELIQQVNEVVLPEGEEQVMQMKDLLLKQGGGRSPAIDFAPAEVDSQLMNFDDFVAQKKAVTGKAQATNAYGMPAKTSMNAEQLMGQKAVAGVQAKSPEWSMESATGVAAGATAAQLSQPLYSMEAPLAPKHVDSAPRVFNMQQLSQLPQQDADSILTQVSDYIVQAKASKEPTVNMKVQHQDLGLLDITVNRAHNDMVAISIGTQDQASKLFLGQHRDSLMSHLTQAGVGVSDLKMEQSSSSKNNSPDAQSGQNFQGQERQFGSEQNQRRHDQQRREELWDLAREKEVA